MGGGFKHAGEETRENEGGNRCTVYLYACVHACVIIMQPCLLRCSRIASSSSSSMMSRSCHRSLIFLPRSPPGWEMHDPDLRWIVLSEEEDNRLSLFLSMNLLSMDFAN